MPTPSSELYTVADKVIVPRDQLPFAFGIALGVTSILLVTAGYQVRDHLNLDEGVVGIFRILSFAGIGTTLIVNIMLYFPVSQSEWATTPLTSDTSFRLNALRLAVVVLASLWSFLALIHVSQPLLHLTFISATYAMFCIYDVVASLVLGTNEAVTHLAKALEASLRTFSRPLLRAHVLFLITITLIAGSSRHLGPNESTLMMDSFVTGMISFNLFATTLVFVEYNYPRWRAPAVSDRIAS